MKIIFICTGPAGRSLMAGAFARRIAPENLEIIASGDTTNPVHPAAIKAMQEISINISDHNQYSMEEASEITSDIVVTLCNHAREICPVMSGAPARIHWSLPDPLTSDDDTWEEEEFRRLRDEIKIRIFGLFKHGFFESLMQVRNTYYSLLDHLTDGVMAHDLERRIFFFNKAAQQITGYSYGDVIGKDCHEVFPGRFCGGNCSFCDEGEQAVDRLKYLQKFYRTKSGEKRDLEMSVVNLHSTTGDLDGALVIFADKTEVIRMRRDLEGSRGFHGIVGRHISMQRVFDSIEELADVNVPILIQGESGTGKEMVAQALHQLSSRADKPFVPVNCGALPEGTLESELFGHVKGAFTGAIRDKKGRFELAIGGTIFLDEIGEISPNTQVKLLRVIQEKSFMPVGGEKSITVDVRIICATNKDLKAQTEKNLFREDLYYRLAVVPITMPPLRERTSDIPLLVEYFLEKFSAGAGKKITQISQEAMAQLIKNRYPGNVRELRNAIQYAIIKCKSDTLELNHLPPEMGHEKGVKSKLKPGRKPALQEEAVLEALKISGDNKAKAARILGVSRTTLYRFLQNKLLFHNTKV